MIEFLSGGSNRIFIFYPDPLGNHPIWLFFFQNGWLNHIDIEFGETMPMGPSKSDNMPQVFAAHRPSQDGRAPSALRAATERRWRWLGEIIRRGSSGDLTWQWQIPPFGGCISYWKKVFPSPFGHVSFTRDGRWLSLFFFGGTNKNYEFLFLQPARFHGLRFQNTEVVFVVGIQV